MWLFPPLNAEIFNSDYKRQEAQYLRSGVFGVFSKLKEIVHCGVILVTLLVKASLWADPKGSFQVLSARFGALSLLTL